MTAARARRRIAPGRLITFEGGEGVGKSTQIGRLADALRRIGLQVAVTREPGGSPTGERIRQLLVEGDPGSMTPLTEALLHSAQRAEHVARTIRPALEQGEWVVSDRFADSTMAYQGYGHKLGRKPIAALTALAIGKFTPDMTLILDAPVKTGLARAAARRGVETRYESMDIKFHERLRKGFLDIARRDRKRCTVIDATQPVDAVTADVIAAVARKFKLDLP